MEEEVTVYIVVWEFRVRPGCEEELLAANRPNGAWVRFFGQDPAYLGTEVSRDGPCVVTVDRWTSREAYQAFREAHAAEYQEIDRQLERLTENEHQISSSESA